MALKSMVSKKDWRRFKKLSSLKLLSSHTMDVLTGVTKVKYEEIVHVLEKIVFLATDVYTGNELKNLSSLLGLMGEIAYDHACFESKQVVCFPEELDEKVINFESEIIMNRVGNILSDMAVYTYTNPKHERRLDELNLMLKQDKREIELKERIWIEPQDSVDLEMYIVDKKIRNKINDMEFDSWVKKQEGCMLTSQELTDLKELRKKEDSRVKNMKSLHLQLVKDEEYMSFTTRIFHLRYQHQQEGFDDAFAAYKPERDDWRELAREELKERNKGRRVQLEELLQEKRDYRNKKYGKLMAEAGFEIDLENLQADEEKIKRKEQDNKTIVKSKILEGSTKKCAGEVAVKIMDNKLGAKEAGNKEETPKGGDGGQSMGG